ncbi:hypothetical protein CORMATOL_00475 [Corynebacterium matruchotii ATCC 33806]|uniref:Uncharacterized protein n=1 Tax=Corynebacterium matruchotii ATCC 33806 TaxID=566549 RepID=C0E0H5_9CORY|nr:hypothetical protein CORMATOL_00475 [Corynebacterium matruchotii ATCC 33806]
MGLIGRIGDNGGEDSKITVGIFSKPIYGIELPLLRIVWRGMVVFRWA